MKAIASLSNLRISPRKVRLVTRALVGIDVREALTQLSRQPKKAADPLAALIASAEANAVNNFGLDAENLFIEDIRVGDGLTLARWLPRAHGQATPLKRRGSKVVVIVAEKVEGQNRRKVQKVSKAISVPAPETSAEEVAAEKPSESVSPKADGGRSQEAGLEKAKHLLLPRKFSNVKPSKILWDIK
ncbi:MAG: 50S ribosomal protein L22 [Candidatus Moraniibacteriota bacterium]